VLFVIADFITIIIENIKCGVVNHLSIQSIIHYKKMNINKTDNTLLSIYLSIN